MESAGLFVTYNVDLSAFTRNVKRAQATFEKSAERMRAVADRLSSIGQSLTLGITAPLTLAGASAINMASDMSESMNKVDVAFKESSKEVKEFAKTSLKQFGVSQSAALDTAALFGDMGTSMGLTTGEAANMATQLTGLSGDLSSFKNIEQEIAKTALAGIFTGETESLKQLGIVMTQTNLELFAMEQGIKKSMKEMTEAEKVNLRYAFVMAKTANAQGDFANTVDGFANQMRILEGTIAEVVTEIGNGLLPLATKLVNKATELVSGFRSLTDEQKKWALEATAAAAAAGPLAMVLSKIVSVYPAAVKGITAMGSAFSKLNKSLTGVTGKVLIVVSAIAGIAVVGKSIYDTYEPIRKWFNELWDEMAGKVKTAAYLMVEALRPILSFVGVEVDALLKEISTAWDGFIEGAGDKAEELKLPDLWANMKKNFSDLIGFMGSGATQLFAPIMDELRNLDAEFGKVAAGMKMPTTAGVEGSGGMEQTISTIVAPIDENAIIGVNAEVDKAFEEMIKREAEMKANAEALRHTLVNVYSRIGTEIGDALGGMISGFTSVEEGLKGVFKSIITGMIDAAIAAIIAGEAIKTSALGVFAIPLAAAAGAVAKSFFAGVMPFAKGGIVSGPTMGLVGEYPGARSNPEVIAPLNKLKGMLGDRQEPARDNNISQSQPVQVNVKGKLKASGSDLSAIVEEVNTRKNRLYY